MEEYGYKYALCNVALYFDISPYGKSTCGIMHELESMRDSKGEPYVIEFVDEKTLSVSRNVGGQGEDIWFSLRTGNPVAIFDGCGERYYHEYSGRPYDC